MKHFRNIGILAIAAFSFIYTEKIANLTLENSEIYQKIKSEEEEFNEAFVNAEITDKYITPGLNGKVVNIKNSFYNMKDLNAFNSYYLIFDTSYPEVTLENNKDKIVSMFCKEGKYKDNVTISNVLDNYSCPLYISYMIDTSGETLTSNNINDLIKLSDGLIFETYYYFNHNDISNVYI